MARVPAFAKAFAGRWRIVGMDNWGEDFLDLVEEAHLTFKGSADGEIAFGALKGFLDVRYGARDEKDQRHDDHDCRQRLLVAAAGATLKRTSTARSGRTTPMLRPPIPMPGSTARDKARKRSCASWGMD